MNVVTGSTSSYDSRKLLIKILICISSCFVQSLCSNSGLNNQRQQYKSGYTNAKYPLGKLIPCKVYINIHSYFGNVVDVVFSAEDFPTGDFCGHSSFLLAFDHNFSSIYFISYSFCKNISCMYTWLCQRVV